MSRDPQSLAAAVLVACLSLVALGRQPVRAPAVAAVPAPASTGAVGQQVRVGAANQVARLRDGHRLDLNRAAVAELQLLPRIGPALAARIVEHRRQHGPFSGIAGLAAVRGIGPGTLAALRPLVCIGADTADTASAVDERCASGATAPRDGSP